MPAPAASYFGDKGQLLSDLGADNEGVRAGLARAAVEAVEGDLW